MLRKRTVYSDAWSYDMSWVGKLYDAAGVLQGFHIADIAELMTEAQLNRWHETKQDVEQQLGLRRHRASGDARILQETWRRVIRLAA
jgi:hypothetical protein